MGDGLIDSNVVATRVAQHLVPNRRGRPRSQGPHPIDVAFGARVRARRVLLGISQERLGELLGLTFQQVQKYERGDNRVSISRAFAIAEGLRCDVAVLLVGLDGRSEVPAEAGGASDRLTLEIAKAIAAIADPEIRKRLHALAKACTNTGKAACDAAV